jgi:hypothetical protein
MAVMPIDYKAARRLLLGALAAVAALPAAADAKIFELGETTQRAEPSCPAKPCVVMSRTTGYQAKVGPTRGIFVAPARGRVVAWSVALGDPTAKQIKYFNTTLGGPPSAQITVFNPSENLYGKITAQSPVEMLEPFLGQTVQFPLERTLPVRKGDTVALTVPTWAPALAIGFGSDTSWRASRTKDQCDDTSTQTAITTVGTTTRFLCLYKTARLTYTVTMITDPRKPAPKPPKKKKTTTSAKR